MKRNIVIGLVLCAFCRVGLAVILFSIDAPEDDGETRARLGERPELRPLHAAYTNLIQRGLWPLKFSEMGRIFGPKLDTTTNWWGMGTNAMGELPGPSLGHRPADVVLPIFASGGGTNCGGAMMMMVSGLHSNDPAQNKSHTDLYAVGDIGYVELYSHLDGEKVQTAVIYFRADEKFVPLRTTKDFAKGLEWEKGKFEALKAWLAARHIPVEETPNAAATKATK
jgi:hypothetical protein